MKGDGRYTVMLAAHSEDSNCQFVRDIKAYPEPSILVGSNRQFNDVVFFCTSIHEYFVLTINSAFCLGDYDVPPTTYCHLVVEYKCTNISPVMPGPTLIHYHKFFATYLF